MFKLALIVCFAMAMTAIASPAPAKQGNLIPARIARSPVDAATYDNHPALNRGSNDGSGNLATGGTGNVYNNYQNSDGASIPVTHLADNHGTANSDNNDGSGNLATGGTGNVYNNYQNSDGASIPVTHLADNHGTANSDNNDGSGNLATGGSGNTYNNFQNVDLQGKGVRLTPSHR